MTSSHDERVRVYDAVGVTHAGEGEAALAVFTTPDGRRVALEGLSPRAVGLVGYLLLPGPTTVEGIFVPYPNQRLRRWPARDRRRRDSAGRRLLAWRLIGVHDHPILAREGTVPGFNGAFVPDRREAVSVGLPYEFLELCEAEGIVPQDALAAFASDVCNLQDSAELPREDGLSRSDPTHADMARRYFEAAQGVSEHWR